MRKLMLFSGNTPRGHLQIILQVAHYTVRDSKMGSRRCPKFEPGEAGIEAAQLESCVE